MYLFILLLSPSSLQASARLRTCTRGGSASLTGAELSNQFSATNRLELCNDAIKDGLTLNRMRAGIPKLSITGSRNDLEYYSSDGEEGLGGLGGESGGGLMMAMRAGRRFTGGLGNNLRNRKAGLIIPPCALPSANVDVLGSIMNEQERWMTISNPRNISKIKIHQDGRLEYEGEGSTPRRSVDGRQAAADVAASTGGGGGGGSGNSVQGATSNTSSGSVVTNTNSSSNNGTANGSAATSTGSGSVGGGVSAGASTSNGESAGGASATLSSGYPDIRTAAARKAPPAADLKVAAPENTETGELVLSMQWHCIIIMALNIKVKRKAAKIMQ